MARLLEMAGVFSLVQQADTQRQAESDSAKRSADDRGGLSAMNNRMKTVFSALAENEAFARAAAAAFVMPLDPTVEELTEIKTAVSEAVSNSMIHGYSGWEDRSQAMVELECRNQSRNGRVTILVSDHGRGIANVEKAMQTAVFYSGKPEERSGMGFTVMESFMDELAGEVRGRERDYRDDDQTFGCRRWPLNMSRLKKKIHTP